MSGSNLSSVPQPTFGDTGIVLPAEADILAGVLADMDAAFGGGLDLGLTTPQGQLATAFTASIGAKNALLAWLMNQLDPAFASGRMQDAIARIYFISRIAARATVVSATCTGAAGTQIPAGALAQATDGNVYAAVASGTIAIGGTVTMQFACTVTGPIACPAASLNAIARSVPGWDAITNPADGVLGRDVESRAAFELRRAISTTANARAVLSAIRANVLAVVGVLDCFATENATASPLTVGGVSIAAHSLYVCAAGGDPQTIAQAIWKKKPPGTGYTGTHTETVFDNNSGYALPYPSYSVSFQIAAALAIKFAVSIVASTTVPSDAATQIANAVIAAFAGADGGPPAHIGGTVYASRFYAPIAALGAWASIVNIKIGTSSATADSVTVNIDHIPTVAAGDVTLTLV